MVVTTIPWNDGSGDNIYVSAPSQTGSQTVTVSSDENKGSADRTQTVTFTATANGQTVTKVLTLTQEKVAEPYIVFADSLVEQICATNWGDGVGIRPSQAAQITDIGLVFNAKAITSFDELGEYFTSLSQIRGNTANTAQQAFYNCTSLKSITLPASVTTIGAFAFRNCTSLESFVLPATVTTRSQAMFHSCTGLKNLTIYGDISVNQIANASGNCGDGTGTLYIDGDLTQNTGSFNVGFKVVHITGDVIQASGNYTFVNGSSAERIIVDGNITRSYTLIAATTVKFIDLGGTYNFMVPPSGASNLIVHLRYNGIAGTPANMRIAKVSKVYVDSQAILNQYLANSAWAAYSSKLDLWSNYNGEYKE